MRNIYKIYFHKYIETSIKNYTSNVTWKTIRTFLSPLKQRYFEKMFEVNPNLFTWKQIFIRSFNLITLCKWHCLGSILLNNTVIAHVYIGEIYRVNEEQFH